MSINNLRLRILPRLPSKVFGSGPITVTQASGNVTFGADFQPIAESLAPSLAGSDVLLQDRASKAFARVSLQNLPAGAVAWGTVTGRPAKVDALGALDATTGAVEQTGASTFAKRTIGGGLSASLMTYGDAAVLYQPIDSDLTSIATSGVATANIQNSAVTFAKVQNITTARLLGRTTAGSGVIEELTVGAGLTLSAGQLSSSAVAAVGSVINSVSKSYTTNAALTAQIPYDDTIPQSSEGTQVLSDSITPSSTSNKVRVQFIAHASASGIAQVIAALFRGAGANAIAVGWATIPAADYVSALAFEIEDSPASTSSTTYSVRVGPGSAVTMRLNGSSSARLFGGVAAATLILEEIKG